MNVQFYILHSGWAAILLTALIIDYSDAYRASSTSPVGSSTTTSTSFILDQPYYLSPLFDAATSTNYPSNSQYYSPLVDPNSNVNINLLSNPVAPTITSQNYKYLTKTPERDLHYATILKQQQQATIRNPMQAFQVVRDQANMRGHMLKNSLQTSDDDVYEVESAPVMKATSPYQYSYAHYPHAYRYPARPALAHPHHHQYVHQHQQPSISHPLPYEMPVTLSIEQPGTGPQQYYYQAHHYYPSYASTMTHNRFLLPEHKRYASYYNQHHLHYRPSLRYDYSPQESRAKELSRLYLEQEQKPPADQGNLFMSIGIDSDDDENNPQPSSNNQNKDDTLMASNSQQKFRYMKQAVVGNRQQNIKSTTTISPITGTSKPKLDPTSTWLDMGAYSANRGSFGWYSDAPVLPINHPTSSARPRPETNKH